MHKEAKMLSRKTIETSISELKLNRRELSREALRNELTDIALEDLLAINGAIHELESELRALDEKEREK